MSQFTYKGREDGELVTVDVSGPDEMGTTRLRYVLTFTEKVDREPVTTILGDYLFQRLERDSPNPWSIFTNGDWLSIDNQLVESEVRQSWVMFNVPIKKTSNAERKLREKKNYGSFTHVGPDLEEIRKRLLVH